MSHPIDDLFKQELTNLPQKGHEKGWAKARILLGFEKRRKKRFFLLLFLGGLVFMTAAIAVGMGYWNNNDGTEISASNVSKIESAQVLPPQLEKEIAGDKEKFVLEKSVDVQKAESKVIDVEAVEKDRGEIVGGEREGMNNQKFPREDVSKVSKLSSESELLTDANSKSAESLAEELEREVRGRGNETLVMLPEFKSEKSQSSLPVLTTGIKESETLAARTAVDNLEYRVLSDKGLSEYSNIDISKLDKLDIGYLDISRAIWIVPALEKIEVVQESKIAFEKSIYVDYQNRFNRIGLGASGRLMWNDRWSSELSFGFNRSTSDGTDDLEINTVFDPDNLADVSSVNEYEFYSLNAGLRVSRHMGRSRFFGGFMVERPIFLNGLQEVQVSPQRTMDVAMIDLSMGSAAAPIASVIDYNLMTVPELDRFVYYGQLGYGYRISSLLDLSLSSSYQFSKTIEASPLLPQGDIMTRQKKWGLGLRVDVRF